MSGYLYAAACAALIFACYRAGRAALSPRRTAVVAAGALIVPAAQLAVHPANATGVAAAYLVFAVLPLLAGRYVTRQRTLADQQRLRIAADMHDSLGRRLSLAAVQAAALEVSDLPAPQRAAVARLAAAVRDSVSELHQVVGGLRERQLTMDELIEEFRSAGVEVTVTGRRAPHEAAYRVVEEGLTNAVRHAPGQPVSVTFSRRDARLAITVTNAAPGQAYHSGNGLAGLAERLREAGGDLRHELSGGQFRLCATLPAKARYPNMLGLAAGIMLLVVLPLTILIGVR